jgi:hypothetical protein
VGVFFRGFVGVGVAAFIYGSVGMLIGSLMHDVYGESELGSTPLPMFAFVCLFWLGVPIALWGGARAGVRLGRASPDDRNSSNG